MAQKEGRRVTRTVKKKTLARAASPQKAAASTKPLKAIGEKQSKAQIVLAIAEDTGLSKRDVFAVLSSLGSQARRHLMKRGSGEFVIPEVAVKLKRALRPATKARKGRNPFTGEEIMIKAKPATMRVKAMPLKALKEAVSS